MKTEKRRIAVHFPRLGPYHIARIGGAVDALEAINWEIVALEVAGTDMTYRWRQERRKMDWNRVTVFPEGEYGRISSFQLALGIRRQLDQLKPDAVAICGYANSGARAALQWCRRHGAIAILMSDSRRADSRRVWWKEWFKSSLVRRFDAALCAGVQHREYLIELGMPSDRIHLGYDVVDNQYFAMAAEQVRQEHPQGSGPYFLSSNRFISRKNLCALITAYHKYSQLNVGGKKPWPLVLLGDGEQRDLLLERCRHLDMKICKHAPWEESGACPDDDSPIVYFPGFRQIEELPRFYAHAGCFVHPAIAEQWGLVLNEAMASSLPVLASRGTGAALNLIQDDLNGWSFDAHDCDGLANLMFRMSELPIGQRNQMGHAALKTVEDKCPLIAFGQGLVSAIESVRTPETKA